MSWIRKLQKKWELKSLWQVVVVLIVFACTGSTVLFLRTPILELITRGEEKQWWMSALYILMILPIYNVLLLGYGFLFGQFHFFLKYEKRILRRMKILRDDSKK